MQTNKIFKVNRYMDDEGREVMELTNVDDNSTVYAMNVPVPMHGQMTTAILHMEKVNSLKEAYAKFDELFNNHMEKLRSAMQKAALSVPPTQKEVSQLKLVRD